MKILVRGCPAVRFRPLSAATAPSLHMAWPGQVGRAAGARRVARHPDLVAADSTERSGPARRQLRMPSVPVCLHPGPSLGRGFGQR
jgi:hypothetical protein